MYIDTVLVIFHCSRLIALRITQCGWRVCHSLFGSKWDLIFMMAQSGKLKQQSKKDIHVHVLRDTE